jgi:hypothetical protein
MLGYPTHIYSYLYLFYFLSYNPFIPNVPNIATLFLLIVVVEWDGKSVLLLEQHPRQRLDLDTNTPVNSPQADVEEDD